MTHSDTTSPPSRYGPPPVLGVTAEAGGYILTCVCRWLRFYATRPDSDTGRRDREKRCKTARGEGDE